MGTGDGTAARGVGENPCELLGLNVTHTCSTPVAATPHFITPYNPWKAQLEKKETNKSIPNYS